MGDTGFLSDAERSERLQALTKSFRPAAPITTERLFAGRTRQLVAVNDLCQDLGRHGVIFGERGVGKTSLAYVSGEFQRKIGSIWLRIGCDTADTFELIWDKFFDEVSFLPKVRPDEFGHLEKTVELAAETFRSGLASSDSVRKGLQIISEFMGVVVCFDEFDRIKDEETSLLMSDCIKTLSDQLIQATIILVGVADTVDALVRNHLSIQRALTQVRMPRMTRSEIEEIVRNGFDAASLSMTGNVKEWLVDVPQGLPYYAHLISRESGRSALLDGRTDVTELDWGHAIHEAVSLTDQSIVRIYSDAIASSHKTIFEEVLLACARANKDDLGFFSPPDVREPLSEIMNELYDIPRFGSHLAQLCERGPILERRGAERRWRYRFSDPMMQPYIIIRGLESGRIKINPHEPNEETKQPAGGAE